MNSVLKRLLLAAARRKDVQYAFSRYPRHYWRAFYDWKSAALRESASPDIRSLASDFKAEDDAKAASDAIDLVIESLK